MIVSLLFCVGNIRKEYLFHIPEGSVQDLAPLAHYSSSHFILSIIVIPFTIVILSNIPLRAILLILFYSLSGNAIAFIPVIPFIPFIN